MFQSIREWLALRQWRKSVIGQVLHKQGYDFFFAPNAPFSYYDEEVKVRHCAELHSLTAQALSSDNPVITIRQLLSNYVWSFAQLMVAGLRDETKEERSYADTPFVSGKLRPHISAIADHIDELGKLRFDEPTISDEELADYCLNRASLLLFYCNGFNAVSIALENRASSPSQWYQAFVQADLVKAEDDLRQKIGLERLLPGPVDGLAYGMFAVYVEDGEPDPFFTWTKAFPDMYLFGRGPTPSQA